MPVRTRSQAKAEIASRTATHPPSPQDTDEFECSICYEHPNSDDVATICGCNHKFCFHCIDKWGQTKNSCPMCNGIFTKVTRGSKTVAESKTYSGNKRKRSANDAEERESLAAIEARIAVQRLEIDRLRQEIARVRQQTEMFRRRQAEVAMQLRNEFGHIL